VDADQAGVGHFSSSPLAAFADYRIRSGTHKENRGGVHADGAQPRPRRLEVVVTMLAKLKAVSLGLATAGATLALATGAVIAPPVVLIPPCPAQPGTQVYVGALQAAADEEGWDVKVSETQKDGARVTSRSEDVVSQGGRAIVINVDPTQVTAGLQTPEDAS